MINNNDLYYNAFISRDQRFDGVFFVAVKTTGIYCRPICPAKPNAENCIFFESAEAAEEANFRPCLRCRPELAPHLSPINDGHRMAHLIVNQLDQNLAEDQHNLEDLASIFHLSSRQIRRIIQKEFGVSPIALKQTRRLLLAKQLLTDTNLSVTAIAFASGFGSLRRFNAVFSMKYRLPPSKLRKNLSKKIERPYHDSSIVQLSYRPPFDWKSLLNFLSHRLLIGVECIKHETYFRTVQIGQNKGWISVKHSPEKEALLLEFSHSLISVLPALMNRLRNLFDLSARPDIIQEHLSKDLLLKESVDLNPGLRVPGAFDGFELALRAILGQQITIKAATTLACRLTENFGDLIETPFPDLKRLSPTPEKFAVATVDDIAKFGIVSARSRCIIELAKALMNKDLLLDVGINPEEAIKKLITLPGIGLWTAHYIVMRALRWPDAIPKEDSVLRKKLGNITAKKLEELSQPWRPWRSYAVMHIWAI